MTDIYLYIDGQQSGPYQPDQLRELLAQNQITADTPAWHKDLTEWSTVDKVLSPAAAAARFTHLRAHAINSCPTSAQAFQIRNERLSFGRYRSRRCVPHHDWVPCLAGIALGPITKGIAAAKANAGMQTARYIELSMFQYANDHNGAYPSGRTSTEVFQKLIDEKYISDPAIFYIKMPGKTRPTSNQLTAENVCYDVTSGVTANSSDFVPLVFSTGYTITYKAGVAATPDPTVKAPFQGIAVGYKNNSAAFKKAFPDGTVPLLIPEGFTPGAEVYLQLTP